MDKDMAYGLSYKLRFPCCGFDCISFMLKYLIPGGSGPDGLWLQPSAEFPGKNTEYSAGLFLSKPLSDSVVYDSNHSFFHLLFKMAG